MASPEHVKAYVACWLQMGKAVDVDHPLRSHQLNPDSIIDQDGYSPEFERNWRYMVRHANTCYLSGTSESIADLLKSRWEIGSCSRCQLLLPLPSAGKSCLSPCPCADVDSWPNLETLQPRLAVLGGADDDIADSTPVGVGRIFQRLEAKAH